jgi:hypothetical protein
MGNTEVTGDTSVQGASFSTLNSIRTSLALNQGLRSKPATNLQSHGKELIICEKIQI